MAVGQQNQPEEEASANTQHPNNVNTNPTDQDQQQISLPPLINAPSTSSDIIVYVNDNVQTDDAHYVYNNNINNNDNVNVVDADDDNFFASMPPGYRFCPLDSELILYYLRKKIMNEPLPRNQIVTANFYDHSPIELSAMYPVVGENTWYFFTSRDKKYLNGKRPNRAAGNGFWKATGADNKILYNLELIGYKKALVYYRGRPSKASKTDWIMHEYKVADNIQITESTNVMRLDDCVLCRIYKKNWGKFKVGKPNVGSNRNLGAQPEQHHANLGAQPEQHHAQQHNYLNSDMQYPLSSVAQPAPMESVLQYPFPHPPPPMESTLQHSSSAPFLRRTGFPDIANFNTNASSQYFHHQAPNLVDGLNYMTGGRFDSNRGGHENIKVNPHMQSILQYSSSSLAQPQTGMANTNVSPPHYFHQAHSYVDNGFNFHQAPRPVDNSNFHQASRPVDGSNFHQASRRVDGSNFHQAPRSVDGSNFHQAPRSVDGSNFHQASRPVDGSNFHQAPMPVDGSNFHQASRLVDGSNFHQAPIPVEGSNFHQDPRPFDGSNFHQASRLVDGSNFHQAPSSVDVSYYMAEGTLDSNMKTEENISVDHFFDMHNNSLYNECPPPKKKEDHQN